MNALAILGAVALILVGPALVVCDVTTRWRKRRRDARELAQYEAIVAQMPELAERGERILRLVPPIEEDA